MFTRSAMNEFRFREVPGSAALFSHTNFVAEGGRLVAGTRNARLLRRVLFVSIVAVSGLVATAPMVAADPCPVLDPGCVLEDTGTTAGGVVDDTSTTAGGVLEDTTTTVGGVVEGAGPIDTDLPDGVVPGGIIPGNGGVLPGSGDTPPGGGGTTPGGGGTTPGGGGTTPGGGTQTGPPSGTPGEPVGVVSGSSDVISAPTGDASTTVGHPFPSFLDDASGGALLSGARLVRTFAFPLVLIFIVIGFVFLQNRIDRKDPKLALAPVGSDYLTFS
jgi:hypothetical protein